MLVEFGLNTDKISINSNKENYNYTSGIYNGGIAMLFKEISEEHEVAINKGITNKMLYTRFNSREFIPDNTLLTYTADLKII